MTPRPVPTAQKDLPLLPIVSSTAHWTSALISLSKMLQNPLLASLLWSLASLFSLRRPSPTWAESGLLGPRISSRDGIGDVTPEPSISFFPCTLIWGGAIYGAGHRDVKQQGVTKNAVDYLQDWLILCQGDGGQGWASGHRRETGRGCS